MTTLLPRLLIAALLALAVTACGDDSGGSDGGDDAGAAPSDEEAFCTAGEELEADVAALTELDVVSEGTNALEDSLTQVRDDVDALLSTGEDLATGERNELERSVDSLAVAFDDLGGELTADNAEAVLDAIADVASAADALGSTLTETCG